jgi:uncharacterized protein (TIGR01615 family)
MSNGFARTVIPGTRGRWNLIYDRDSVEEACGVEFEFLDDGQGFSSSDDDRIQILSSSPLDDCEEEECSSASVEENREYWEKQNEILHETLYRTSSLESRIRNLIREVLKEKQNFCRCGKIGCCKNCLMREVADELRNSGFNSAICRSKWRSNSYIPSGEHTFLCVVDNSTKREVRVIIELNFRAEFELARANEEYNRLVSRLPEVFVGKMERLQNVIKIVCSSAKKCMKEKKIHLGPWRKQRYMQAKWLGLNYERTIATPVVSSLSMGYPNGLPKPMASILAVDLLDRLPSMHCTTVEVL